MSKKKRVGPNDFLNSLKDAQSCFEQRFNCIVCMEPKLEMVYGWCQHRLCADCLYNQDSTLRTNLQRCPICAKLGSFPTTRPDIPEDSVELQKCLGVRVCPNSVRGCKTNIWDWEMDEHLSTCQFEEKKKRVPAKRPRLCDKSEQVTTRSMKRKPNKSADSLTGKASDQRRRSARLLNNSSH
ncbi:uncharacterized protein LOC131941254 [Physella acuta]|uniref:uncharacterized protein LOC131941254 n=1 Tax=Physella acuta TaxID=109671 RepID=UPI0027DD9BD1|nr:uncharacterized protein LOC131941254 [Physella acuta]XP_059156366.1 uncharacterized protein LOC131941254 [Physella acuta]